MMQYLKCVLLTVLYFTDSHSKRNGDRAIVSAKLISVFPYDLYSVSFNNCNTALSQASSRSCRILLENTRLGDWTSRKHLLYLSNIQLEYLYACSAAVHEEAYIEYQLRL